MSMLVRKRFEFVDIAKGICILLIIRGHINYSFFQSGSMRMSFIQFGMCLGSILLVAFS